MRKKVVIFLVWSLFLCMSMSMSMNGCGKHSVETVSMDSIHYYTDIPEVTQEEAEAIETLKVSREVLTYGSLVGTEMFLQPDGSYEGFTYEFCELLTNLFGIKFEAVLYDEWDVLKNGHDEEIIDFMGELCPTPERMEIYQMSNPIAEHALRIFTCNTGKEIIAVSDIENLRIGFLSNTVTASYIQKAYPLKFEVVDVDSYKVAADKLLAGEIDAFVEDADADIFFLDYDEIQSKKFFSMVYSPISMSSANSEFAPIISVINKYLTAGGVDNLLTMYEEGEYEYAKYKLSRSLKEEEKAYLDATAHNPVKLALENDNYPVSFYNYSEEQYQGIAIDILEEISYISGIQFEVVTAEDTSWTEMLEMLKTGEAAMLSQLLYTDKRKEDYIWSKEPYSFSYYALLSSVEYPDLSNYQVARTRVGTLTNSAHEQVFYEWFPEYTKAKQYKTQNDAVEALDSGEIDLLMASEFLQLSQTNYYENSGLKINILLSTPMNSYFGFHKDEKILCSIISQVQSYIDTYAIEHKWTSRNFDYQKKAATERMNIFMLFSIVLVLTLILVIVLFIKNVRISNNLSGLVGKRTEELEYKDHLLQAVNHVASILLQSEIDEFDDNLHQCMGMMADSVGADRVYIWENYLKDGMLYCTQVYEWSEQVEPQQGKDIAVDSLYSEAVPGWEETLSAGQCINSVVRNMSVKEQEALSPQGILSILVVPVFLRDDFWGFVGFDDCKKERVFSEAEVTVLRSGSMMIASALLRNEMALDIQEAIETAREASRAKSNFLSNMSHEIRTPLNAITGMTLIGKSAPDMKKKDYALEKIEDASAHLLGIINDILDMSKIEANKFALSEAEFDFEMMLQKTINVVNFRIHEKKQRFHLYIPEDMPHVLIGDSQRLAQVITNLLSNAVKFTPEESAIWLDARIIKKENDVCTIQITVTDEGIGIDPARQEAIFDAFEQAENNTMRKYGGTGLGLSISKYIVELMGGSIWVESALGKGSKFAFTVQLGYAQEEKVLIPDLKREDVRALAVDDEPETREYFISIAGRLGIQCDTAASGEDALRLIDSGKHYNIFFVDWNMPGMDGMELSRAIKRRNLDKALVIMVSAFDWSAIEEDALDAGVDKFLPKPIFLSAVAECINECIGRQASPDFVNETNKAVSFFGRRILLAEDVEINREIVLNLLESTQVEIDCAENGREALQMFCDMPERYDLIFMDIQMPEMDGFEATRSIRSLDFKKAQEIPIIAMTANVFREDIEQCKENGMNDHIGKPLDYNELIAKIGKFL